jgi:hypothetical protein
MNEHNPIKRDPAIADLSRAHHFGLQLVWKIRYGIKNNISVTRICSYVLFSIVHELEPHFRDEERYLFPLLKTDDPLRTRAESEHKEIRNLKECIIKDSQYSALFEQFANVLELHIRFEERELFNDIQDTTTKDLLARVGVELVRKNALSDVEWLDQFWIKESR